MGVCPCQVGHKWLKLIITLWSATQKAEAVLHQQLERGGAWEVLEFSPKAPEVPCLGETACLLFNDRCTAQPVMVTSHQTLPVICRSLLRRHSAPLLWPASWYQWGWAPVGAACVCIMLWKWNEEEEWIGLEKFGLFNGSAAIFFFTLVSILMGFSLSPLCSNSLLFLPVQVSIAFGKMGHLHSCLSLPSGLSFSPHWVNTLLMGT